jgi:hypothetical protein
MDRGELPSLVVVVVVVVVVSGRPTLVVTIRQRRRETGDSYGDNNSNNSVLSIGRIERYCYLVVGSRQLPCDDIGDRVVNNFQIK